jgi:hypothetical protein
VDSIEPKNGNGTQDDPVVVEVKNRPSLPLADVIKLLLIGVVIAVLIPTSVTVFLFVNQSDDTRALAQANSRIIKENRDLIKRVETQRLLGDQRAYEQCVQGEARDTAFAETWGAALIVLRQGNPTDRALLEFITTIEDNIAKIEPPDEEECKPPTEVTP